MQPTKRASLEDLKAARAKKELAAPKQGSSEIDMPEGFWDTAQPQRPRPKQQVNLRVDPDIIEFFKAQGSGHLTRMHAVLRSYVDAQKERD